MYASLKTLIARSASRSNARRLILALCLGSLLLSLWTYTRSAPLPLLVIVLNLATLLVMGLQQWRSRKSIKFQPHNWPTACCKSSKTNATASAASCMTISANCSQPPSCKANGSSAACRTTCKASARCCATP